MNIQYILYIICNIIDKQGVGTETQKKRGNQTAEPCINETSAFSNQALEPKHQ